MEEYFSRMAKGISFRCKFNLRKENDGEKTISVKQFMKK
jgi:hypothetical protein